MKTTHERKPCAGQVNPPKPAIDGSGYVMALLGVEIVDEATLTALAEEEVQRSVWDNVSNDIKDAFVKLYGKTLPPETMTSVDKLAVKYGLRFATTNKLDDMGNYMD